MTSSKFFLYIIRCENNFYYSGTTKDLNRRIKEIFTQKTKWSKSLLKNNPENVVLVQEFSNIEDAKKSLLHFKSLDQKSQKLYIFEHHFKPKNKLKIIITDDQNNAEFTCKCGFIRHYKGEMDKAHLLYFDMKNPCICDYLKEKIDHIFQNVILSDLCMYYGKYIFTGSKNEQSIDNILGFSGKKHVHRTRDAYFSIDMANFQTSYFLLGSIIEEIYYILLKASNQFNLINNKLKKDYRSFSFKKEHFDFNVRFRKEALFIRCATNVLKHNSGIIDSIDSGKDLQKIFKMEEGMSLFDVKNYFMLGKGHIGNIPYLTCKLYYFCIDLAAEAFNLKRFKLSNCQLLHVPNILTRHEISDEYIKYLEQIGVKQGDFLFM